MRLRTTSNSKWAWVDQRLVCVDFGASGGIPNHWQQAEEFCDFVLVEPSSSHIAELQKSKTQNKTIINKAAHAETTTRNLYCADTGGATLYKPNISFVRKYVDYHLTTHLGLIEKVEVVNSKDLIADAGFQRIDIIKIDTQGSELDIMAGLKDYLDNAVCIFVEMPAGNNYEDAPVIFEYFRFLKSKDYELFDIQTNRAYRTRNPSLKDFHRKTFGIKLRPTSLSARVMDIDALFFKSEDVVNSSNDPMLTLRLAAAYCLYRYYGDAWCLIDESKILSPEISKKAKAGITALHKKNFLDFLHDRLSRFLTLKWGQYRWRAHPHGS